LTASDIATIESASNVTAAITTNVTTGSTTNVTVVDPNAVAMTTNASVAELVAPNTTINGLVTAALLDDAAYVAAPVPVVSSTVLNISANNASASVLVSLTALRTWAVHRHTKSLQNAWWTADEFQQNLPTVKHTEHPSAQNIIEYLKQLDGILAIMLSWLGHATSMLLTAFSMSLFLVKTMSAMWLGANLTYVCAVQANISTLQTTLQTNVSSPTLDQVTSSNDLPSSDSRVLVQFNSLAATSSSSVLPSDVAAMDMVINSTFLANVDTHVLNLDNTTANVSDVVTALRARDGTNLPFEQLLQLSASAKCSCGVFTIMQFWWSGLLHMLSSSDCWG
jgi:hypothetical protein